MLPWRICYRVLNYVVVVEYGLKLGGEKVADIVSSYFSFEGDIDDNFEGVKTVSGMKKGKRYSPEGEVMGSTYRSRERSRFGE